jgi:hypothetical protein
VKLSKKEILKEENFISILLKEEKHKPKYKEKRSNTMNENY